MKIKNTKQISIIFILAVVLPGVILSLITIRAASRENAYIEYRLRNTFISEMILTKSIANEVMERVKLDLDSIIDHQFETFMKTDSIPELIQVPFLLSQKREIVWPLYNVGLSNTALNFFKFNKEFFQDRVPTPIYRDISKKENAIKKKAGKSRNDEVDDLIRNLMLADQRNIKVKKGAKTSTDYFLNQKRKEIKINSDLQFSRLKNSVDYVESLKFSQIIENKSSGIIPRLIDNQVMLLYWKKTKKNEIQGCVVNEKVIAKRIIARIPQSFSEVRILTILDQNREPFFIPNENLNKNWKEPFLSQDLHKWLPQWEVATYLTNPNLISKKARLNTIIIGFLVMILLVTITFSGIIILRSLQEELKLAQQKTTFVANVSHELKTPLTSIRIFAEILKEKRQPDEMKQKKYLGIMVSEIERLTRLINNVLDFSQSKKGEKQFNFTKTNLVTLCNELVEVQRVRLEHNGFDVQVKYKTKSSIVNVDIEAIKQALVNIISNAEKYSAEDKFLSFSISTNRNFVTIDIADKGIGVNTQDSVKIFNEFYRVDDSLTADVRGTGLGLAITKKIIEAHHGTIECLANKPKGSIFRIVLPLAGE